MDLPFTGERLIPGKVDDDLWAEHLARYVFVEPLARDRRVLDLGAGAGYGAELLSRSAKSVAAVDIALEAMQYARSHNRGRAVHAVGHAGALPFKTGSFDLVVAFEVLEHVADGRAMIAEARRVLAPSGIFVVSTPNPRYYTHERGEHNDFHVHEFEVDELRSILAPLFRHVRVLVQNHASTVTIEDPAQEGVRPFRGARTAAEAVQTAYQNCHYAIAICSETAVKVDELAMYPRAEGNVLRERERHIAALKQEVRDVQAGLIAHAQSLEGDLRRTQGDFVRVDAELREAAVTIARLEQELNNSGFFSIAKRATKELRSRVFTTAVTLASIPVALGLGAAVLATDAAAQLGSRRRRDELPRLPADRLATIQILNYEGKELLERNLPSVVAAVEHTGRPHQIVVVDNGSTDGSVEMLRENFPQVSVVPLDRNYFFSRGNNQGVPHARHDILILLNNDMRVEKDFLPPLLEPFEDPDVFAVSSQIFFPPGIKRREETGLTRARFRGGMLEYSHDPIPEEAGKLIPILWGGGGSCAFDKRKWNELGGLDEMFDPFYCEDLDLSWRASKRGWKVLLATESKVWHEHRATSRRFFSETYVQETFRRNSWLLHWANLRDPKLLAAHLSQLPLLVARDVRLHGRSGARSFVKAVLRAPRALRRRMRTSPSDRTDARILADAELAAPDPLFHRPKLLEPDAPLTIVMVTPYHFWPIQHGGAVRMYHAAREMARRGHQVSIVGFVDDDKQLAAAEHLREFCADVRLLRRSPRVRPEDRFALKPPDVIEFDRPELHRELNLIVGKRDPDIIQVEYTQLAPYGRPWSRAAVCLTEHDVAFVSLYRRAQLETSLLAKLEAHERYLRMFRYEIEALRRFDAVFTVSDQDRDLLGRYLNGVALSSAGRIGVDLERFAAIQRAPEPATLLFVGFFGHRPNVDAILWFGREVLPRIHAERPEVRLEIAGAGAPHEVRGLAVDPRISLAGFVPNLGAHYARATVFLAPVRAGSGVRVKMLEAFAAGVPVVATDLAAEGLALRDEARIAAGADGFARETLQLLADPHGATAMAARARRFVEESYGWRTIGDELEREYRAALRRKGLMR